MSVFTNHTLVSRQTSPYIPAIQDFRVATGRGFNAS
jgi:hypothetical protein